MAETAEVIQLFPSKAGKMPERFNAHDSELLLRWAMRKGYKYEQLIYAVSRVRDWAQAGGKRKHDWVATVRNAMSDGWALRGYDLERARKSRQYSVRGTLILATEREITEERIRRHLAMLRE